MRREPVGVVAPITAFDSLEHALEIANATEFGYGREGGAEGVLDYTVVKTTHITL